MRTLLTTLHSKFIHPSLALPYLAAYCADSCGELVIREFTVHEPKEHVLARIIALAPDVVVFSVYIWNRRETLDLLDALQLARPEIRTVFGGPEISFERTGFFRRHPVNALIQGEGEIPLQKLLSAWERGAKAPTCPGLSVSDSDLENQGAGSQLTNLDLLPSPFQLGLVDLKKGLVYYETSRGCPYSCSFCMSALDEGVRSFSMERIKADLGWLMEQKAGQIKLVDRTFNYARERSLEIFEFILQNNQGGRFHFEIGAHLLDDKTLRFLENVPAGLFQFEIGVQSTLPETLNRIERAASFDSLAENVSRLRRNNNINLHLDLIAGLPGESRQDFMSSLGKTLELKPHHLQIEPVKLLPGSPLRQQAAELGIIFDPHAPYTVLRTPEMTFSDLDQLRGIGRLLDLTWNSGRFRFLIAGLSQAAGSVALALERLEAFWNAQDLFSQSLSQRRLFEVLCEWIRHEFDGQQVDTLQDHLARDFAWSERAVPNSVPDFFNTELTSEEDHLVRQRVKQEVEKVRSRGGTLKHFAAVFNYLPEYAGRTILLFVYLSKSGARMQVEEIHLNPMEKKPG